ncbi:thioredoxin-dependent thiol peroxidase [Microbacterium sp. cx-55]|uniref:thioredoxin-dependent thiol peroxidase n=1 Tax=Microbacterium sp. cx-55 TaxID=2875948 RepID=UPI001CC0E33E|nr:thioredoxin-dependent thiol peroxidase [Microbacterium sp. cx-55]MBZ4488717.1 thioredoxin-dependent thiol peroxidase [Microbacterium sp. cx-55]UGB36045.1 thioredoxin-dependent thiol peroxidase [Microbacterium sp. cx-55]
MTTLHPGDIAPDFTLADQDGQTVSLHDLRGRQVIVYFYPAAMTPGCTTQACDFRDSLSSLEAAGFTVLGVSRDTPVKLREFRERDGLTFSLLADEDHAVHDAYGAWGEKMNYGKRIEGVRRSTFVIDPEGRIVHAQYNVKATGHVARLRRMLSID